MVAKTMILSKLWYQSYFDLPNAQQIKTITNDYWNFINGKATTSRISYKNCYCTPELGGFNALNIEMKLRTNLCSWKKKINEGHPWCYLLKKHMDLNVTLLPSRTRDILASWNRLQTVENEDHISIIGINKNLIELNKATSKDIYLNIMLDQIPKTITPKDNQDINDLKHYFKWIKKSRLDNKTKVTVLKLLHRKLYSNDNDGGISVIYNTTHSIDIWNTIKLVWKDFTNSELNSTPKNILDNAKNTIYNIPKKNT